MQTILHFIMKAAKAKPSSKKALKLISVKFPSAPPMSTIFKFQLKLIIGGADQSMRKIGFTAFFGLVGFQNRI